MNELLASSQFAREIAEASDLARGAGQILLEVYATDFAVEQKDADGGPVTEADRRASAFIVEGLRRAFPGDGVVSEELSDVSGADRRRCWYVDPLDGTREFVNRNGEFAIHIGLSVDGKAAAGVVYRPIGGRLFAGAPGSGATVEDAAGLRSLHVSRTVTPEALRLVASRSHFSRKVDQVRKRLGITEIQRSGSVGLKCGMLAEGTADLYVHVSRKSYRWDICAPEAVLRGAGGVLTDLAGKPYAYDGEELQNLRGLLACSTAAWPVVGPVVAEMAREEGLV